MKCQSRGDPNHDRKYRHGKEGIPASQQDLPESSSLRPAEGSNTGNETYQENSWTLKMDINNNIVVLAELCAFC